jgi:putative transposase
MTSPRQILPGEIYHISRRCLEQRSFLAPGDGVEELFAYLLAEAAERCEIVVLAAVQMSNHYHVIIHDPLGRLPLFLERFNGLVARSVNRLRDRKDRFWDGAQTFVATLMDPNAVVETMAYVLCNPVKAGLVTRSEDWPGFVTSPFSCAAGARRIGRPALLSGRRARLPDEVRLAVGVPPTHAHLSPSKFAARLARRVKTIENRLAREMAAAGRRFGTRDEALKRRWEDAPTSSARRSESRRPKRSIAAKTQARLNAALERQARFRSDHAAALGALRRGHRGRRSPQFPGGTWKAARVYGAPTLQPPPPAWALEA